jgi:hypothetical protein
MEVTDEEEGASILSVPDVVECIGQYLDQDSHRSCVLAHRDLAPVTRGSTFGHWKVRPDNDYARKTCFLLRYKPRLATIRLTVDGSSTPLTTRQEGDIDDVSSFVSVEVVHKRGRETRSDAKAETLLSVLQSIQAPRLLLSESYTDFPSALRVIELCEEVHDIEIHEGCLTDDDVNRLRRIVHEGKTVNYVRFFDDGGSCSTAGRPEVVRLLRDMAVELTIASGAAFSVLARVADRVRFRDRIRQWRAFKHLGGNTRFTTLSFENVDMSAALFMCEPPITDVLREGDTLELGGVAVQSLDLPGFLSSVLAETRCNVILHVDTLLGRLITARAMEHIAEADPVALALVRVVECCEPAQDSDDEIRRRFAIWLRLVHSTS